MKSQPEEWSRENVGFVIGPVELAAALHGTPDQILALVRAGVIRADHVRDKEPRWRAENVAGIIKQLLPMPQTQLDTLNRARLALGALIRAEEAEAQGASHANKK